MLAGSGVSEVPVNAAAGRDRPLRLLTLGSCRVHDPIRAAASERGQAFEVDSLRLVNTPFFHTVATNLQHIRQLCGEVGVAPEALPLIYLEGQYQAPTFPGAASPRAWLDGLDGALIEICDQTELIAGDLYLHANEVHRAVVDGGGPAVQAWWAALYGRRPTYAAFEAAVAESKARGRVISDATLSVLRRVRAEEITVPMIVAQLKALQAYLGKPVGVVTHIDCLGADGQPIARRRAFIDTVHEGAAQAGMPCFRPQALITEFGQARVLAQAGRDSHHYEKAFLPTAGERLFAFATQHFRQGAPLAKAAVPLQTARDTKSFATAAPPASVVPPLAPAAIEALEAAMVRALSARLAALGDVDSGLGSYYASRVRQGRAFSDGDRMLLQEMPFRSQNFARVIEAGAGYGQLGLALGLAGLKVMCIEADRRRFACLVALQSDLAAAYPAIQRNVTARQGVWPGVLAADDLSKTLLVAVDFVFTGTGDIEAGAIAGLKRHGGAVIDASHFVHSRLTGEQRQAFYAALHKGGVSEPDPLPPHMNTRNSAFIFVKPA